MRKFFNLIVLLCIGAGVALAQTRTVTGTVTSDFDGEPVIGASVAVEGTTLGTVTNADGKFVLEKVPNSATTIVISYIGMETQKVAISSNMDIVLHESAQNLDEVIVVAFGTAKKSAFTGSASTIKTEDIAKRQVSNVTNALSGQVAGVQVTRSNGQPGTTSTVRIRGVGSMSASNTPLYVVDGVPYDGDISSINTADIESTTVLKDAASNALYGARGANGVILITTKKGQGKDGTISFDAKWGTNRRGVPRYDLIDDPATYYEKAFEATYNGIYKKDLSAEENNLAANKALLTNSDGGVGYLVYTVPNGENLIGMNGKLNPNARLGYTTQGYTYIPDNWYNELFDSGNLRQEYNLNVSGQNDKLSYYMSLGYLDDSGIIENSGFRRYSGRANADYQAKKWFKIGTNLSYTNYDLKSPASQDGSSSSANLFYLVDRIAPIYPLYARDGNGNIIVDSNGFTVYDFGDGTSGPFKRTFMSGSNPASMVALDKRSYIADVFSGRWYADIMPIEGLKFTYKLGVDVDNTEYNRLYNAYYGQYSKVGGIVYKGSNRTFSLNQQQLISYKKLFNNIHDVDILLGHETYSYRYSYLQGSKEKLFNPEIMEIDNAISNPSAYSYTDKYAVEGWFVRGQYEYDGKYIASASYRRDASSRFHPDNRWGNFGSIGGAWVVNKENFMESTKSWIDFLKYKISFGIQGNDNLGNYYPYQDQYEMSESNGDFATTLSYKGNKDITWETSYSFNTGFDFELFKRKLTGSIEYFNRKTVDMLYFKPVAPSNGYASIPMNIGSVNNRGVEIDLNSELINTNNIKWSISANATFLKNKIIELAPELEGELISGSRIYREGESMYQMYLRKYAGVNEEGIALYYKDILDANGNPTGETETTTAWSTATRYAMGDMLADVYGGFGTKLDAYGFDASISFAYQLGGRVYDSGYASAMHNGTSTAAGGAWHKDILNSWSETNKNTDIPRVSSASASQYANSTSDRFLISSNYLDITNITIGYSLPKNLLNKAQISRMRLYLAIDNAALFSKRKGLDPRQGYTSASAGNYSPIRTISGGINISF